MGRKNGNTGCELDRETPKKKGRAVNRKKMRIGITEKGELRIRREKFQKHQPRISQMNTNENHFLVASRGESLSRAMARQEDERIFIKNIEPQRSQSAQRKYEFEAWRKALKTDKLRKGTEDHGNR